jgi:hypothetical protein
MEKKIPRVEFASGTYPARVFIVCEGLMATRILNESLNDAVSYQRRTMEKKSLRGEKRSNRYNGALWYYVFWWEGKSVQIKWLTTETLRTLLLGIDRKKNRCNLNYKNSKISPRNPKSDTT